MHNKYIRIKNIPEYEISGVYDGDLGRIRNESGVCVFDCIEKNGAYKIILPSFSLGPIHDLQWWIDDYSNYPIYLVEGTEVGTGSYGEPTIVNVKIIAELEVVELENPKPIFKLDRTNKQLKIKK